LILASNSILTADQFPDITQRAIAWLTLLAFTLSGVSLIDWHLTRHAKQARDEAWSFIHRQVLKVWWLLMFVAILLTFATFFYGGSYMIFAAWVVLPGLGLYVHGLFSEELLEWVGALIIAIGIGMLAFRLSYNDSRWVAASTLGLGLPLLSAMLDRGRKRAAWFRLIQSAGWLLCVLIPPLLAQHLPSTGTMPDAPIVSLQEFLRQPTQPQIVALPAGSAIPVKVEVSGDVFRPDKDAVLSLTLNAPLEIMMNDGQPTGDWRFPGEGWTKARGGYWISIPWIKAEINPQDGPEIHSSLVVEAQRKPTR